MIQLTAKGVIFFMEYRINHNNDNKVSLLGMGCMRFPLIEGTEDIDIKAVEKMVDFAIKNGVNYFDTAYPYHGGKSEGVIGNCLATYPRESFYLADKLPIWKVDSNASLQVILDEQLDRCKVDYFDYYLCHAMCSERVKTIEQYDIYDFLLQKKRQGVLKQIGFSFHDSPAVLRKICEAHKWDFVQLQINYLDWELGIAKTLYNIAEEFGLQVIIMEPVRGGALASLCEQADDIFKTHSPNRSVASWAIRYAAGLPQVLTVLSGMSNMEQLVDNVSTISPFTPLSMAENDILLQALDAYKSLKTIPCTGCKYCIDCPRSINIPEIFALYNKTIVLGSSTFASQLAEVNKEQQPNACITCGKCSKMCPQQIDIPAKLKALSQLK